MISVAEADRLIRQACQALPKPNRVEWVPITAAIGRRLAQAVMADRDQPPFDRVAMDGLAVVDGADRQFRVTGLLAAGQAQAPNLSLAQAGTAIEVMTGAALPPAWNAVVPWEHLEPVDSADSTHAKTRRLRPDATIKPGQNIHRRGSDYRKGACLIQPETLLSVAHLHTLASVGLAQVPVFTRWRLSLLATGDELVPVDQVPLDYQIRQSNMVAIEAYLNHKGLAEVDSRQVPDDRDRLAEALSAALSQSQMVIVGGGVSVGYKDYVPQVLQDLGCRAIFHGLAQKPGKPFWFGLGPTGAPVFGLPGNPVSSLFLFRRYILANLSAAAAGRYLPTAESIAAEADYTVFYPARVLDSADDGPPTLAVRKYGGSGNFSSIMPSDGIVEIPAANRPVQPGQSLRFFAWD